MFNFLFKKTNKDESLEEQRAYLLESSSEISRYILEGDSCDEIKGAFGEFGKEATNPIPVNGPRGEIKYLNRLHVKNGPGLIYHRTGSINASNNVNNIDVFEIVSLSGDVWDILYFDMYHPRRSTKKPKGYEFDEFHEVFSRMPIGFGTTQRDNVFPFGVPQIIESKQDIFKGIISCKGLARNLREIIGDGQKFKRPKEQEEKLKKVAPSLESSSYFEIDLIQ
jgi:hypothetical protein